MSAHISPLQVIFGRPMTSLRDAVRRAAVALNRLQALLPPGGTQHNVVADMRLSLRSTFDEVALVARPQPGSLAVSLKRLKRKLSRQRQSMLQLQKKARLEQVSRISGRIQHLWLVRAGLSDPPVSCSHFVIPPSGVAGGSVGHPKASELLQKRCPEALV